MAVNKIIERCKAGYKVIVVVSAMGRKEIRMPLIPCKVW